MAERVPREQSVRMSPHYAASAGESYAAWQLRAMDSMGSEAARRFAPFVQSEDVCLDFGCGGGSILVHLDVRSRIGVEPNAASREVAASRGIETIPSLDEVLSESVDVVVSHHALEHCREPFRELVEMHRVVRAGGRLVLILPMEDWRRSRRFHLGDVNHHLYGWNPLLIGNLCVDAGFVVDEVSILRHAYPPGAGVLWRVLPEKVFDLACGGFSVLALMRQLRVVARRPL